MQFKNIIGQKPVIDRMLSSYRENRVAHTQLFLGTQGTGVFPLAMAFAQFINCQHKQENDSCGVCPSCKKYEKLSHPDLHFFFPTTTNDSVKKDPKSELFLNEFREYATKSGLYITQSGWYNHLKVGNKQGSIFVRDAGDIIQKMALKSYEAPYKVIIIWMAERLNDSASNKLLKTFEEPPENTIIILIAERYELILPTVRSRSQLLKIPKIAATDIKEALIGRFDLDYEKAENIAALSSGNWNLAQDLIENTEEVQANFIAFRQWLRYCFKPGDFIELNKFNADVARLGREKQKGFLNYGLEVVHQSMLHNQNHNDLVLKKDEELDFSSKLAPFINAANQLEIYQLLNEAVYHVERNAHPGILFTDLSFKLIDLLQAGRKSGRQ
ncbi:MAG: DNA polymerase III subunit delta' [Marinilabiliales bacterium]|jgi:DNA polymerase-3 subunit delta'|nr:MAG: DNA polymerase III subunit delta' [Marinilabiliales bacterium]